MSPATGIAASQLRQLIFYNIDNELLDNATFLAGRLYALEPRNPDSSHMLALTYLRQRRFKSAYDAAQKYGSGGRHLGCAYVFAQACLELGKWLEGATALEKAKSLWHNRSNWNKHSETSRRHIPDAAAVQTVLAKLWRGHGDLKKASEYYVESHKANPFIWDSFEGLCKIGASMDPERMFRMTPEMNGATKSSSSADVYADQPRTTSNALSQNNNFNHANVLTPSNDPFNTKTNAEQGGGLFAPLPKARSRTACTNGTKAPLSEWDTPTANSNGNSMDDDVAMGGFVHDEDAAQEQPPHAPSRRVRTTQQLEQSDRSRHPALRGQPSTSSDPQDGVAVPEQGTRKTSGGHKRTISGHASQSSAAAPDSAPPRRSNRLFGQGTTTRSSRTTAEPIPSVTTRTERETRPARTATGAKGRTTGTVGRVVSGNRKILPPDPADKEKEKEKIRRAPSQNSERPPATTTITNTGAPKPLPAPPANVVAEQEAISGLLKSFRQLAVGCHAAYRYDSTTAIDTFESLPAAQRETPWVLAQLAKTYYEAVDYRKAETCFSRLVKMQPSRVDDMEVFSTVLWHLKKEAPLAFLCHTLREQDFNAPETWCAIGNSFSLAREHDQAIAAFKRATQLDNSFAYAWTLMGHEYIANEEFDAALACFRKSVSVDRRSYNGWYGLGRSLERMGKLEDAERHYRIAAQINPSNATLMVCIGVIYEKLRKKPNALNCYTRALQLAPQSALARFKKARVLMHMREFDTALQELIVLRDLAPDEANVWFLLGKCWKGLGEKGEALRAFTTALNLDVKASPFIKEAMESLDDDEDMDSEED